uniref:Uncharacterized protein n=1 Tax=Oryza glumipatula TaxID=40148 RepID=A0A0E0BFS1_9ORYZ
MILKESSSSSSSSYADFAKESRGVAWLLTFGANTRLLGPGMEKAETEQSKSYRIIRFKSKFPKPKFILVESSARKVEVVEAVDVNGHLVRRLHHGLPPTPPATRGRRSFAYPAPLHQRRRDRPPPTSPCRASAPSRGHPFTTFPSPYSCLPTMGRTARVKAQQPIREKVGWGAAAVVLAAVVAVSLAVFLAGWRHYRYRVPEGSPLTLLVRVTSHGGRAAGWFGKDLNNSRLDLFYWLLACIGIANLVFYVVVATRYSYKTVMAGGKVVDDKAGDIEWAAAAAAAY